MKEKLEFFIGPCVLESEGLAMDIAGYLMEALKPFEDKISLTFKGSFDKANRSSFDSYRGPGLEAGLKILENVKKKYGLPTVTDFHLPDQAEAVASVVDTLQVPAFLCRQTDMVCAGAKAVAKHGGRLKVKKGQFLSPEETKNIVDKVAPFLSVDKILLTERGSSFGYNNLVVDMASFQIMKSFGAKTIHDATHCVQRPGGLGKATGGKREQILVLARAAIAAGAQGIFMETHPNPDKALSDSATALPLDQVAKIVESLLKIYEVV
ncbi:MAG: 3-deoxy-8-phosphooctulonate synthase [Bdellovibrionales bacterium CG12_big_fil_rev_8_21_14_0_65_38_15]|nr:MAG: 3-deoxy-8-phosphooctulonate synthase [Bdellovibrionales bacterium CG22_combo_CG10-13_8_21_14_all_38_13]PIQ57118.1 MAG: 3-deoxy-8-phosphooctulonate synthase [Bdellovibrionales bacterium CG12_big_fil_rev_8_21_14_0_65_38_15]PIR30148.1 MAG: 3-deoxy-8-phosphooctulonate synthase [Bdellovibrionales bacterium CG11_big_fil_rev_8_21_14_0_20_38_13]